jgi:DNA-binding NtrC family response regulator
MPSLHACTYPAPDSDLELHYAPDTTAVIAVLAVTASDSDWNHLQQLFNHSRWRLERRRNIAEAREHLLTSAVPTIICDDTLPDGNWRRLVEFLSDFRNAPRIIVISDCADDRLWDSVLASGAYDLLEKPVRAADLYRSVSDAWHGWKFETQAAHSAF